MTPVLLITLAFATGLGSAVDEPIWQAITSEAVPRRKLLAPAITLGGVSVNLARAIGPALGGLVVGAAGPAATFALNALTFLWVAIVLVRSKRVPLRTRRRCPPSWLGGILAGLAPCGTRQLVATLVRCACVVAPASCLTALLPIYARVDLGLSSSAFGALLPAAWESVRSCALRGPLPAIRAMARPRSAARESQRACLQDPSSRSTSRDWVPLRRRSGVSPPARGLDGDAEQPERSGPDRDRPRGCARACSPFTSSSSKEPRGRKPRLGEVASRAGTRRRALRGRRALVALLVARASRLSAAARRRRTSPLPCTGRRRSSFVSRAKRTARSSSSSSTACPSSTPRSSRTRCERSSVAGGATARSSGPSTATPRRPRSGSSRT